MNRSRMMLAVAAVWLSLGAATAATAAPVRFYQGEDSWYVVSGGAVVYSLFAPDGADGVRTYGQDPDAPAVFTRIKAQAPKSFRRLAVGLEPTEDCSEERTSNAAGVAGWSFSCRFTILADLPPAPTTTPAKAVAAKPSTPAKPATPPPPVAVATAPVAKPVATPPAAPPRVTASAPVVASTAVAVQAPPAADGAQALNADIIARNEGVEARNRAAQAKYDAQVAEFERQKKASQDAYAAQVKAHEAEVAEVERRRLKELADWQARVKACQSGDRSQCAQ